jgi:hypothetical protein
MRATDGEADPDRRVLSRRKANYSPTGATIELRWSEGALLSTGTVMQADASPENRQEAAEAASLGLLAGYTADDRPVSMAPPARNYAPLLFGRRLTGPCFTRRDHETAMNALLAAGRIREENYGRPGHEHLRLRSRFAEAGAASGFADLRCAGT